MPLDAISTTSGQSGSSALPKYVTRPTSYARTDTTQMNLASISLKNVSISLAKISVCMTYLRLFPSRANKIFSWTMITYQSIWGIVTSTLYVVQCV